ncbi:hypothetical protein SCARR_01647 [Pontiella sulfatireligans]|uniref:Uncharacterized protein n=1 Tax=Pontiella sulfatireligans TaxID=2750658 RepID=A0A6C2UHI0_9BACT|nr:hypothetical protein SCARR_01647 [Pontiella sulfatireligans]
MPKEFEFNECSSIQVSRPDFILCVFSFFCESFGGCKTPNFLFIFIDDQVIERGVGPDQLTKRCADEAIAWIEKVSNEGKPFFLYLPHTDLR